MFMCEYCAQGVGVAYVQGIVLCEFCFTMLTDIPWDTVTKAKFCPCCETKFVGQHKCNENSYDAETLIKQLKVTNE